MSVCSYLACMQLCPYVYWSSMHACMHGCMYGGMDKYAGLRVFSYLPTFMYVCFLYINAIFSDILTCDAIDAIHNKRRSFGPWQLVKNHHDVPIDFSHWWQAMTPELPIHTARLAIIAILKNLAGIMNGLCMWKWIITLITPYNYGWLVVFSHPSEKYDFVNWDDDSNPIFLGK